MLIIPPAPIGRRRRKPGDPAAPAALTLVSATYSPNQGGMLVLSFDRPIDISGLVGSQIIVDDWEILDFRFDATGTATLDNPTTVRFQLEELGSSTSHGLTLTAGADNGIVAVDDGGTWAGVTDLSLPFP